MITHERLLELLAYDPETGEFRWKVGRKGTFAGTIAGNIATMRGGYQYRQIIVNYKNYRASRLAWFYMTGEWPKNTIDHIDTNSLNNKWDNLREANDIEQCRNKGVRKDSGSKCKNVHWHKPTQKWQVYFVSNGKKKSYGLYDDIELANLVACEIRDSVHGEFSRHQ
jgi:hypothetical protein